MCLPMLTELATNAYIFWTKISFVNGEFFKKVLQHFSLQSNAVRPVLMEGPVNEIISASAVLVTMVIDARSVGPSFLQLLKLAC